MIYKIIEQKRPEILDTEHFESHKDDSERLQYILKKNGYASTILDCYELWCSYSYSYAAGWICLPDDDEEVWNEIKNKI